MMRRKTLILPLLLAALIFACVFPNLDTEYYAKERPDPARLIGKYVPTTESLKFIREKGHYTARGDISIALKADETFEMVNMPDWWLTDFGTPKGGVDSGAGRWNIIQHQSWWELDLSFDSLEHSSSQKGPTQLGISVPIVGVEPPYDLWFYIGDPDEGDVMIFQRAPDEQ